MIGIAVLANAAFALNPVPGVIVLIAAVVIAARRLIRRWRNRRR
ncbi:hypothetical protein [Methylobacterium sp. ID0610]